MGWRGLIDGDSHHHGEYGHEWDDKGRRKYRNGVSFIYKVLVWMSDVQMLRVASNCPLSGLQDRAGAVKVSILICAPQSSWGFVRKSKLLFSSQYL